jgi:NAD(P)-dependent dehydrogenase (short-subunit alcohol dehydrogenase family)
MAIDMGPRASGVAIVTGAAGGMGRESARLLAEDGWTELLLCDLSVERLEDVAAPLRASGCKVDILAGNIADPGFCDALGAAIGDRPIGAMIHTAGVSPRMSDTAGVLAINLDASVAITNLIRPRMAKGAAAVLFSSMAGHFAISPEADAAFEASLPPEGSAALMHLVASREMAYPLSKRAVRALVRREATEFGKRGARIVSISPGLIDTAMTRTEIPQSPPTQAMYERSPLSRLGDAAEVAAVAVFLCSPAAGFVSGIDILVDGGIFAAVNG